MNDKNSIILAGLLIAYILVWLIAFIKIKKITEEVKKKKKQINKPEEWFERLYQINEEIDWLSKLLDQPNINERMVMHRINELKEVRKQLIKEVNK